MFNICLYREIYLSPASPTISAECCAVASILPNGLALLDLTSKSFEASHYVFEMSQSICVGLYLHYALPSLSSDETCPIVVYIVNALKEAGCVRCSPKKKKKHLILQRAPTSQFEINPECCLSTSP